MRGHVLVSELLSLINWCSDVNGSYVISALSVCFDSDTQQQQQHSSSSVNRFALFSFLRGTNFLVVCTVFALLRQKLFIIFVPLMPDDFVWTRSSFSSLCLITRLSFKAETFCTRIKYRFFFYAQNWSIGLSTSCSYSFLCSLQLLSSLILLLF